jgi:hypothetical protein
MRKVAKLLLVCAVWFLALREAGTVRATQATEANSYQAIAKRNVFALNPPVPPPPPVVDTPPLPKLYLQGITTILNIKKALIKVQAQPRPGEAAKGEESLILGEGQREGGIEVRAIDEKLGRVTVDCFGTVMDIDFDHNGVKAVAGPAPVAPATGPPPTALVTAPRPRPFPPRIPPLPGS